MSFEVENLKLLLDYSKAIKSEEKSYGLEARISVERFFEEVVNERFRDAHARLGGAEREKISN